MLPALTWLIRCRLACQAVRAGCQGTLQHLTPSVRRMGRTSRASSAPLARAALGLACALALLCPGAAAACAKTHPYVGFAGDLTMMDHSARTHRRAHAPGPRSHASCLPGARHAMVSDRPRLSHNKMCRSALTDCPSPAAAGGGPRGGPGRLHVLGDGLLLRRVSAATFALQLSAWRSC
jgi:hypothetical protein